jgi:hypothetical protein
MEGTRKKYSRKARGEFLHEKRAVRFGQALYPERVDNFTGPQYRFYQVFCKRLFNESTVFLLKRLL